MVQNLVALTDRVVMILRWSFALGFIPYGRAAAPVVTARIAASNRACIFEETISASWNDEGAAAATFACWMRAGGWWGTSKSF
jgi:hypothetical protein